MVPIAARDCEERALRDIMPALGYVARVAFPRVSTKVMSLGATSLVLWWRGSLLNAYRECHFEAVSLCKLLLTTTLLVS